MPAHVDDIENLLWCVRPALDITHLHAPLPEKMAQQHPVSWPYREASLRVALGHLIVTETVNQERSMAPIFEGDAEHLPSLAQEELLRVMESEAVRTTRERLRETLRGLDPLLVAALEHRLFKAARALEQFRKVDLSQYRGIIVATQHSSSIRAVIVAAGEQDVPVTYIPHAPVAGNPVYLDLPVSVAGLRGDGEVDYYSNELGIPADKLAVVGNLASHILDQDPPTIDQDGPGLLALSPHTPDVLEQMFSVVSDDRLGPIRVAPHPATQLKEIRPLLRPGWELVEGRRTLDLLREGPAFVLHLSSGVAWESAALGIPTATIRLDHSPVNYPFLADERVYPSVFDAEQASAFVDNARARRIDRASLIAHARRWCNFDGDAAADRLRDLLQRTPAAAGVPLHDGWSAGGRAIARSWIADTAAAPA